MSPHMWSPWCFERLWTLTLRGKKLKQKKLRPAIPEVPGVAFESLSRAVSRRSYEWLWVAYGSRLVIRGMARKLRRV